MVGEEREFTQVILHILFGNVVINAMEVSPGI
jgi:hypothetical protein